MADEPDAEPLDSVEDEGGPIKSFLDHLEDLRWVLIKIVAFAGVAMVVCLLGGNYLVKVLEWPLARAPMGHFGKTQVVKLAFGTNQLTSFQVGTNDPLSALLGTNEYVRLQMVPLTLGTNQVFGFRVEPEISSDQKYRPRRFLKVCTSGSLAFIPPNARPRSGSGA